MSHIQVALIRAQEHDYDYRQWHEDIRLGYLLSVLRQNNVICQSFDFAMRPLLKSDDYLDAIAEIANVTPDLVIFVVDKHPTNNPFYTSYLIRKCREESTLENAHFSLYGNTTIGTHRLLRELPIDSVVVGEENDCLILAKHILYQSPALLGDVPGIAWISRNDEVISTNPLPLTNLDSLPQPSRYFFELPPEKRHKYGYVGAILASRGCYGTCTFCNIRSYEKIYGSYPWRGMSPNRVVDEIEDLYKQHGVKEFSFLDSNFFGPGKRGQEWAKSVAQEILTRGISEIAFSIYARANDINLETFELLKKAGLYAVFIGVESFSQDVLDRYLKGTTVQDNINAIRTLMDLDIRVRIGFITFDHFTTLGELRESIKFLKEICSYKPHLLTQPIFFQNILVPLEDTPLGDEYLKMGLAQDWVDYKFGQLFTSQQKRAAREGKITAVSDSRIAYIVESTRVLGSELLQRSTALETQLSETLISASDNNTLEYQSLDQVLSWFDNLMPFIVSELELVCDKVENDLSLSNEYLADQVVKDCEEYDKKHLGYPIKLPHSSLIAITD